MKVKFIKEENLKKEKKRKPKELEIIFYSQKGKSIERELLENAGIFLLFQNLGNISSIFKGGKI